MFPSHIFSTSSSCFSSSNCSFSSPSNSYSSRHSQDQPRSSRTAPFVLFPSYTTEHHRSPEVGITKLHGESRRPITRADLQFADNFLTLAATTRTTYVRSLDTYLRRYIRSTSKTRTRENRSTLTGVFLSDEFAKVANVRTYGRKDEGSRASGYTQQSSAPQGVPRHFHATSPRMRPRQDPGM